MRCRRCQLLWTLGCECWKVMTMAFQDGLNETKFCYFGCQGGGDDVVICVDANHHLISCIWWHPPHHWPVLPQSFCRCQHLLWTSHCNSAFVGKLLLCYHHSLLVGWLDRHWRTWYGCLSCHSITSSTSGQGLMDPCHNHRDDMWLVWCWSLLFLVGIDAWRYGDVTHDGDDSLK